MDVLYSPSLLLLLLKSARIREEGVKKREGLD